MKSDDYDHSEFFRSDNPESDVFGNATYVDSPDGLKILYQGDDFGTIWTDFKIASDSAGILEATVELKQWPGEEATLTFSLIDGLDPINWGMKASDDFKDFVKRNKGAIIQAALEHSVNPPIQRVLHSSSNY